MFLRLKTKGENISEQQKKPLISIIIRRANNSPRRISRADQPAEEVGKHGVNTPMQRAAQPEEVAPAFVFFASNADSSYITGEVLTLLGGEQRTA